MADVSPQVLDAETDARFWASTGYKPGQKLDPTDATDKAMEPVWRDIYAKVKHEADTGKLVTTYNHPAVAQHLAEAHAHDQDTVAHLDAASKAPDLATAQHHVASAATSADLSTQKTSAAAALQPASASPQLMKEASQTAAQNPRHPHEHGHHHLAQSQATSAHKPTPEGVLDKETDARFWAGTGYRPGQKLDKANPTDAKMIPVWLDTFAKVKAEDAAGKLVLTYNNPVVAQRLADAYVADKASHMHADAAAAAPPHEAPQHVAAAATAAQVAKHKAAEAAKVQPPTVSPARAHAAGRAVAADQARMPPPSSARDAIAQEQAKASAAHADAVHRHHHGHGRPVHSTLPPQRLGEYRAQAAHYAHDAGGQYVLVIQHPDGKLDRRVFRSRAELDAVYAKLAEHHDHYRYVGAFDLNANPSAPVHDSVGVPAAEHVEEPAPSSAPPPGAGSAESAPDGSGSPSPSDASTDTSPESSGWSTGTIAVVAAGIVGAGGLLYAVTRKPSPKRGQGGSPRVLVATGATPARALRP